MHSTGRNVFQDERGSWSFARVALALVVVDILVFCWWVVIHGLTVANAVWAILSTMLTGLLTWAVGPRLAAYVAPAIGSTAQSLAQAIIPKIPPTEPTKADDERGA
jgi:hypothetical protein